jgi:hypothetical protein
MNSRAVMAISPSDFVCTASRLIPIRVKKDMSLTTSAMLCNKTQVFLSSAGDVQALGFRTYSLRCIILKGFRNRNQKHKHRVEVTSLSWHSWLTSIPTKLPPAVGVQAWCSTYMSTAGYLQNIISIRRLQNMSSTENLCIMYSSRSLNTMSSTRYKRNVLSSIFT